MVWATLSDCKKPNRVARRWKEPHVSRNKILHDSWSISAALARVPPTTILNEEKALGTRLIWILNKHRHVFPLNLQWLLQFHPIKFRWFSHWRILDFLVQFSPHRECSAEKFDKTFSCVTLPLLAFSSSVLLLTIALSQSAREKLHSYCKINNVQLYWMEMVYPLVRGLKDTDGQHSEGTNAFQLKTDKKSKRKLLKQESEKLNWKIVKNLSHDKETVAMVTAFARKPTKLNFGHISKR